MHKASIILIALLIIVGASCKNRHKIAEAEVQMETLSTDNDDSTFVNDAFANLESDLDISGPTDSISSAFSQDPNEAVVVLERGACFGRCPIYKVRIFANGSATYEGINFVDKMGRHTTNFSTEELALIEQKAFEFKLDTMAKVYDQPRVTDLPTTIIGTTMNGQYKQIKMRHKYPESLRSYRNFLEELFKSKTWLVVESNRE